jgi:NADPH-dependent curcumin reductase CurA
VQASALDGAVDMSSCSYFDNVGGESLEAAIDNAAVNARIIVGYLSSWVEPG